MSATKVRTQLNAVNTATNPTTLVGTFRTTADQHPSPSMLHAHDLFAISAAATATPMKAPACQAARFLAKNNNINYNNNYNNNNGALSNASSRNKKSTQPPHTTCDTYSATAAATTTTTTTTTTTNTATRSALTFCEHCCESASMKSSSDNDRQAEAARLYCEDVDSVSGELSSFRLISEEEASTNSVSSVTRSVETNNQTVATSTRPSSPATTAAICCYTIGHAAVEHNATVVSGDARPSTPVPIPPPTNCSSAATSVALSTSLPSNCVSVSGAASTVRQHYCSIPQSTVKRKPASAPVPPPKPQRDAPVARHSNKNRSFDHASYDPTSFHRKLQKFEKRTALLSPANSLTRPADVCDDEERAECSSPEPCELLNCFGAVKSTHERGGVARNASSSGGCCAAPHASNLKTANNSNCSNNNNNNNNNNNSDNHVAKTKSSVCAIAKLVEANNNYNCKINVANSQSEQQFSSTPVLNKRILRYDSCGRLKADGSWFQPAVKAQKSLSESRLPQSVAGACNGNKFAPAPCGKLNFYEASTCASINNGYAPVEHSNYHRPNSKTPPTSPKSPKSPTTSNSPRNRSDLDLSFVAQQQPEAQLFKSYSDTQNFVPNNLVSGAIASSSGKSSAQTLKQPQQRSYSDYTLKSSNYPNSVDRGCRCAAGTPNAGATTTETNCSQSPGLIHQKNSVSLPNVPQSNGSQSPVWLSSETVASSRCELKCSDDTQSVCSDQTTIFHLEHDYSSSSSPSSQICGNVVLRGPLLLTRIPEIQSFGYLPAHSQSLGNANAREQVELSMEKRRNTLDRFQRLGFGRKSSPSSSAASATQTQTQSQESHATRHRKSSEKSEKLKELTELLRGNRSSPTPPPVPPPRRPRHEFHSATNSFEQPDKQDTPTSLASAIDSTPLSFMSTQSDDILLMDHEESNADEATSDGRGEHKVNSFSHVCSSKHLRDLLKPHTSLTNIDVWTSGREKSRSPPPILEVDAALPASSDIDTKLSRPESRTVIGSYAQKGIPFRSASFSQLDYSSGKYKKSALSVLRDRLRRDKAVDRAPSPTLPRNKDTGEAVLLESEKKEPDWVYIPLKRADWNFSSEHKSLEDVAESPDAIIEEDVFAVEKEPVSLKQFDPETAHAAHAKMESLSDAIVTEKEDTVEEEQLPITVESENLSSGSPAAQFNVEPPEGKPVTSNLATLMEEEMPLESPPDNFLQTATTCLIPVPVYECAAQDWRLENPPSEWVEVASEEFGIVPETLQPLVSMDQCSVAQPESTNELEHRAEAVPTISVKRSSEEEGLEGDEDILRKKPDHDDVPKSQDTNMLARRQASLDYPEVKKRYSHDDLEIGTEKRSSLDSMATRYSADERKRLDKSRRRKGMYIESTDWSDGAAAATRALALDITIANFNAIKDDSPEECSSTMYLNSPITDENRTPGSLYSLELNTPDSEPSKPPIWSKAQRLISFSCQSSEEKDESHSTGSGRSTAREGYAVGTPGVSLGRNNTSYPFLRTDSISDNESDRTPPPSGVGSSENDFKRYSKRPLRGPYGQMLEAEMKKPNKMHFEEILEELRESEGISSQSRRGRVPVYGGRHEDADDVVDVVGGCRNMPQHSNSMRVRKTNTYLPVPSHARAASTPSQMENVNTGNNVSSVSGLNKINPHEKRYQSTLDNAMTREKRDALASEAHQHQHQHHQAQAQLQQQQQREIKRAASETPAMKPHHSKRSQSMGSEKPAAHHQHHHQQKRSLDVSSSVAVPGGGGKQKTAANLMPTQELLAELLKGSSEKLLSEQRQQMFADTRTHVVQEIFKNEQSYVESLQTVVMKYLKVLKAPENAGMIDSRTVDEIFFMVPDILEIHQKFLGEMRARLDNWDTQQKVGDAFMETFSKLEVLEVYTSFVNNCNRAKNAIRSTKHQRPSFAKFLETTAREHKGKLTLDNLLIKPVQKFPNYEMLFSRLIKHTDHDHPDQKHLQDVLKLVHDILVHINCKEREILENGQREAVLRELEGVIEGIADLSAPDRQFLLFDLVSMPSGQGARKERGFFLFNDLLVLTSIKKRSGTIRKPNPTTCPGTVASTLDTNKYKFLTKISLDCLEIVKTKDENLKRIMSEIENLAEDCNKLQQITEITASLKYPHQYLEDVIRELHRDVQRQLSERQTNDAQLNMLELAVTSPNGSQKLSIVFNKAEKRSQWEKTFNDAKQRLAATLERHPIPEFLTSIPIRKTRAGLQFTCAAATLSEKRNVWVCNSDGYVGQVCIMSLHPEPNVSSCNGVCNARILCVASVPAFSGSSTPDPRRRATTGQQQQHHHHHNHQQSDTQQHDFRKSNSPSCQIGSCAVGGVQPDRKKLNSTTAASNNNNNHNNNSNNASSDSNTQLDLNFSSSDDEPEAAGLAAATANSSISTERVPSPAPSLHPSVVGLHQHQDSNPDEGDGNQSTMWIGTEDGCIHVYNSTDNIRIKKNRIKIEHHSAVYSILYLDNRVFVSLANGDICVYWRDGVGWNTSSAHCVSIGTVSSPVSKLLSVHGKLWCSIQGIIKVLDIETLLVVNQIQISTDSKPITNMAVCNNYVWISIQNSAHIKCFHSNSHHLITEVNLAPAVNKMLSNCDEIIRQHKAACLRVTSLLSCKDLIWIGTSAGVLLTIPAQGYEKGAQNVVPTGIPHGHTGHVRFLTFVETSEAGQVDCAASSTAASTTTKDGGDSSTATTTTDLKSASKHSKTKAETNNILVISGGDGYEDFRNSGANSLSEIAGREDSTNHLLIWQI